MGLSFRREFRHRREDDEALAKFVRQDLEAENYSVDVLSDGEQARTAATAVDYDVVILDLNLPKLDGVSVLRYLRLKKPSLPVLVLTQRNRVEDQSHASIRVQTIMCPNKCPRPRSTSFISGKT